MFRKLALSALIFTSVLAAGCASIASDAPAKAADGVLVGANGMTLYTFDRDGGKQWAYKGKPVYFWSKDQKPGDRSGDGFNGAWRLARP